MSNIAPHLSPEKHVKIMASLGRFKFASIAEGIALFILLAVMVLEYGLGVNNAFIHAWPQIHGIVYILYAVFCFDLWSRMRWSLVELAKLLFYGVIPVLSFFGERWVSQRVVTEIAQAKGLSTQA